MTTLDNLMMATNTIPAQHSIQGMLSSMTDEDSFIPTTISSSNKQRKADATKILALRMLQGYKPTNHKCTDCNIPLMQSSNSGIVQCVVCVEQLQSTTITPAGSMSDDDDESEIRGSMLDDDRDDNNHQHHSTKKQNKKSVVSITQEGDIELRQLGTHESLEAKLDITWCTKDGLQNEIVVGESKSSERSYNSDDVDSTSSSVEQLDDSNDTRDSNVVPTLPAFNSINYPHLIKEMETRRISALEQQQKQQQTKKKTKGIKGIKLLEAIDEMSAASSAKKKLHQQLLLQQQLDRHEQLQEESQDKECATQAEDSSSPIDTASPNNNTTPTKFDSTKIIEDTNNILNDLVSTEGSGDGGTSVADAVSTSPSIMSDGYGYSKKSMKKLTYQSAKKDAEESATKYSSSPLTGSQRKRMTINNISSEPQQREDRRKVGGSGVDTHDVSYTTPEASPASSPKASQHIEKDDFFSEIRRKALLSKVSTAKNKLDTELCIIQEDGIEGAEDTSVKQQPTWDNVSALESPSSFILPKLNGGIKRPVFGIAKVEEEVNNTVPQSLVKSTKLVGLETSDELHQRLRAANIRQHKSQQLHDEMSPAATITRKKTLWTQPVVPDDEKRELALQSIRKEGVILPFDESTKLSQKILHNMSNTTPKMNNLKTSTEVVTVEECSSDEEVGSKKITQAPSESSSFASLSSSVQLQTKRIAQLEADAQRKHQEAELAATTAREALAGMLKKRNVRHDKDKKGGEETTDYSVASASQYSYRYPTADSLIAKNTAGSKTKINLQPDANTKDKMEDDNLSMSSTLSSLDNKTNDKDKPKKKGGSIDSEDSSDSNDGGSTIDTNTTTSTYLDKLQRSLDKRIRRHSLRASRRELSTLSPSHQRTPRRPPSLRVESSDSSTSSSYTLSTYDSMPERRRSRSIERRSYDRRHHRSLSTPRSRRNGDSCRRKVVPSLMLPSLSSSASPSSRGEQHPFILSPHEQYHPAAPPRPHTTPNQQIQYHPGRGFENGYHPPIDPSFGSMIRPSLLSQRVASEPVLYQQQPLMAQQPRELHYSADGGHFGMPPRRQQYSPSLSSRMATLKLAGLSPNHPYGKIQQFQGSTGSYPSGAYPMVPQQKVRFNTAPLPVYESRNDFPTSRR